MCCAVLVHVTYLVKTTSHDSAPPPLLLYKPEPHIAVDIPRGLPPSLPPLPCPCPCLTNPAFPQISPDFNPNLAELTNNISLSKRERGQSQDIIYARLRWEEQSREGTSAVWLNSPFSLIGRVGNTYPFCAPPLRFRSVHADECSWFDYLTVTGKFGGAQWRPNSNTSCNTKKGNRILDILPQRFNLENFFWQWFIAFSLTCMCQNTCVYRFGANQQGKDEDAWDVCHTECQVRIHASSALVQLMEACRGLPPGIYGSRTTWCSRK